MMHSQKVQDSTKNPGFLGLKIRVKKNISTLPRTNIAPENGPSQNETSIPTIHFQVQTRC